MGRITVKIGILFALIWISFKMILFATLTGEVRYNIQPSVMVNILCLLLAITVGLYLHKRSETQQSNALNDIKNGLSAGLPYTIIVAVFLYFYYDRIDPEFNKHQLAESEVMIDKTLNDPKEFQTLKASNEEFEVMTKEEIRAKLIENRKAIFSPGATMTTAMLAMLVLSTVNSIFVTVVYRRLIFRR